MASHRFVYLLGRARHRMFCVLDEQAMARWGITSVQLGALFALAKDNGCQLKALADTLGLDNSAVTGLARRLVSAGVVTRQRCEADRRSWRLYLTPLGQRVASEGAALMTEVNQRLTQGMSDAETDTAARFLQHIIDTFR